MNTEQPTPPAVVLSTAQLDRFEAWWEAHGQFCRAGGGDYEKTLAYRAFEYAETSATKRHAELCRKERVYWKLQGQKDTGDFELCAVLIEQSNAIIGGRTASDLSAELGAGG
jgi:hypothetical protein